MKAIKLILLFGMFGFLASCGEDEVIVEEKVDLEGPDIFDVRWIDHPSIENDPAGPIVDGGNYTISIEAGFQVNIDIMDDSNIESGVVYFLANNDPDIRENIIYEGTVFNYTEGTISFVHRVDQMSLGAGVFYDLKAGDVFHFYSNFTDEHGNESSMSWTADLID